MSNKAAKPTRLMTGRQRIDYGILELERLHRLFRRLRIRGYPRKAAFRRDQVRRVC